MPFDDTFIPGGSSDTRPQIALTAGGLITETFPASVTSGNVAPPTGAIEASMVGFLAGDVVTGIVIRNSTAAAGSLPTTCRFGIADSTGKMLILSGNLNALANWGTGLLQFPFTSPLTISVTGGYYLSFIVNGTWGTTQPTPIVGASASLAAGAVGASPPLYGAQTGQTDLPAIGNSFTLNPTLGRGYYMAAY